MRMEYIKRSNLHPKPLFKTCPRPMILVSSRSFQLSHDLWIFMIGETDNNEGIPLVGSAYMKPLIHKANNFKNIFLIPKISLFVKCRKVSWIKEILRLLKINLWEMMKNSFTSDLRLFLFVFI
jgi:hypothetical protein